MAQRITRWHPDTCDCVIDVSWDDEVSAESRVHTLTTIQKCALHQAAADADAFAAVNDENTTKNKFLGMVHENHPELCDVDAKTGAVSLKSDYEYKYSFDENRKLQAEIVGVDKATAQAIAASAEVALGEEKVDVKIP